MPYPELKGLLTDIGVEELGAEETGAVVPEGTGEEAADPEETAVTACWATLS